LLGAAAEPTWGVTPRLRLLAGLGLGWGTGVAAPPPYHPGGYYSARRTATFLDLSGALGGTVDVIPSWVTVSLLLGASLTVEQSGALYRPVQAIPQDPANRIDHYQGLPEFSGSLSALLGVGVVL